MVNFRPFYLVLLSVTFLLVGVGALRAQEEITGSLIDGTGRGIIGATITVHQFKNDDIFSYGISEDKGRFQFSVPPSDTIIIRVRALGYRLLDTTLLLPFYDPLVIKLSPGRNVLPETVVRADRAPITKTGDTTVVNFRSFRDSTDRKVVEVLSKIPGIDVASDGSIKINGKAIDRILVEGSDLFGKDYQLASENINAADIGRIEVIQHYEQNPVLRQVNTSDDIVINLKLEDHVHAALAGSLLLGGGYGEEVKYKSYGTLYRIARKDKTITIGSADNTASGNSFAGIENNYKGGGAKSVQPPMTLYNIPGFNNARLPAIFTDNADRAFLTVRHESTVGPRWRLNINGVVDGEHSDAAFNSTETFLGDTSVFRRSNSEIWQLQRRYGEGQLKLNYLGADHRSSFDLGITAAGSVHRIEQTYLIDADTFKLRPRLSMTNLSVETEYVRAIGQFSVLRLRAYHGNSHQPVRTPVTDFSALGALAESENVLSEYTLTAYRTGLGTELLHRRKRLTQSVAFDVRQDDSPVFGTKSVSQSLSSTSRYQLPKKSLFTLTGQIGYQKYLRPRDLSGLVHRASSVLEKKFSGDRTLSLSLSTGRNFPDNEQQLINLNSINDGFSVNLSAPAPERTSNHVISLFFNKNDDVKLTNLNLNISFRRQRNAPTFSGFFQDRIVFNKVAYGVDRSSLILSTGYSWFMPLLKSNLKIRYTGGRSESALRFEEEIISIDFISNTLTFDATLLLHPRIRLISRVAYRHQYQLGQKQIFTTTSAMGKLFYQTGVIRLFASYNYVRVGNDKTSRYADGSYFGADKKVKAGKHDLLLKVSVFNAFNRSIYRNQTLGESFIYTSTVNALPRFVQVSADFTL